MRKILAVSLVLIFAMSFLVACSGGGGNNDSRLVGTLTAYEGHFRYELNADGTGARGLVGMPLTPIEWRTENNSTFIVIEGGMEERWSYTISGSTITFESPMFPGLPMRYRRS